MKLSSIVDEFLQSKVTSSHCEQDTVDSQRYPIQRWLNTVGDRHLRDYKPQDGFDFISACSKEGIQAGTVNLCLGIVEQLFRYSYRMGHIKQPQQALSGIRMATRKNAHAGRQGLTVDQRRKLSRALLEIDHLSYKSHHSLLAMALYTGMRPVEIIRLEPHEVVLDHDYPHVDLRFSKRVKTPSSRRVIPLAPELLKAGYPIADMFAVARHKNGETCLKGGRNYIGGAASRYMDQILGHESNLSPYSLRHTFARTLNDDPNVPLDKLAEILGHAQPITRQIYSPQTDFGVLAEVVKDLTHLGA